MSRSFFTLLRLCTGRKLVWAFLACFALLFYELVQLMLTAYGNAGQVEIMGIDLPPLVLAAEAFGRSAPRGSSCRSSCAPMPKSTWQTATL